MSELMQKIFGNKSTNELKKNNGFSEFFYKKSNFRTKVIRRALDSANSEQKEIVNEYKKVG